MIDLLQSFGRRSPCQRGRLVFGAVALGLALLVWPRAAGRGLDTDSEMSPAAARALEAKIEVLSSPRAAGPPTVVITEVEANSYLKYRGPEFFPAGFSNPEVRIRPEGISGAAQVDFDQLRQTGPKSDDWASKLLAMMLNGKQRVAANGKLESGNGQAKLKIENVQLGTTTLPDWLVSTLLENYVQRRYKVDLSKPLALPDHVTHIELGDGRATLYRSTGKNGGQP